MYFQLTELGMQVAILYYGRRFIQSGQMSTGNLVSFILYQTDLGENIGVGFLKLQFQVTLNISFATTCL